MIRAFDTILRDTRYAIRSLRRSPSFVLTVAATIALGIGINTALFTLFNAYVLRPIAVRDPYSLYTLTSTTRAGHARAFTWKEYQRLTEDRVAFSEVAAVMRVQTRLDGRVVQGQLVTGNYFQMLGVGTALVFMRVFDARACAAGALLVAAAALVAARRAARVDPMQTLRGD